MAIRKEDCVRRVSEIPAKIGDTVCKIRTEVENDIPLLLNKESLKRANAVLDLKNDKAVLFGNEVKLKQTSSGHYCVTLKNACSNHGADKVLIIEKAQTNTEKRKITEKLHKQFGHSNPEKLKSLLKDAGNSVPELSNMVDEICKKCEVCLKFKKPDPKPVVAYPLAREFNETVA